MFKLNRRLSTVALLAASAATFAASPASASASPAGPSGPALTVGTPAPEPVALLLPAVQKVREAAARMKCAS